MPRTSEQEEPEYNLIERTEEVFQYLINGKQK